MIKTIKRVLNCYIQESEKEWDPILQDIFKAYHIKLAGEGLSPYSVMFGILPRQLSRHMTSCTHRIGTLENIFTEANRNERYSRLVQVMKISSQRADRFIPRKSTENIQFRMRDSVIVALSYEHSTNVEQKRMGPCFITGIRKNATLLATLQNHHRWLYMSASC